MTIQDKIAAKLGVMCECIHCKRVKPWNETFFQYNTNTGPKATEFVRTCRECSNARQRAYVKRWKKKRRVTNGRGKRVDYQI